MRAGDLYGVGHTSAMQLYSRSIQEVARDCGELENGGGCEVSAWGLRGFVRRRLRKGGTRGIQIGWSLILNY